MNLSPDGRGEMPHPPVYSRTKTMHGSLADAP